MGGSLGLVSTAPKGPVVPVLAASAAVATRSRSPLASSGASVQLVNGPQPVGLVRGLEAGYETYGQATPGEHAVSRRKTPLFKFAAKCWLTAEFPVYVTVQETIWPWYPKALPLPAIFALSLGAYSVPAMETTVTLPAPE
jgi:hypothetical protein